MYVGTSDGSIPPNKLEPTGDSKIDKIALEMTISAAKTYQGPITREEMAIVLSPLVIEGKINCNFLLELIENAGCKGAGPLLLEGENGIREVFMGAGEINAILMAFERMELLTFDFEKGQIWWVCQEQSSGSYYSCLTILPSPHAFTTPLYFCGEDGEETAKEFTGAFAAKRVDGGLIYLKEVTKTTGPLQTKDLLVL